jgi:hypothetical protein
MMQNINKALFHLIANHNEFVIFNTSQHDKLL